MSQAPELKPTTSLQDLRRAIRAGLVWHDQCWSKFADLPSGSVRVTPWADELMGRGEARTGRQLGVGTWLVELTPAGERALVASDGGAR